MPGYISCSIVLYKNAPEELVPLLTVLLDSELELHVFLVDNSPTDELREVYKHQRLEYIFSEANLGYGKGHNIAINQAINRGYTYHIVCNPDIYLDPPVIQALSSFMDEHKEVGQVMPKIMSPDGSIARLCKLLPTPLNLFGRRFLPYNKWLEKRNAKYQLEHFNYDRPINAPSLSGCFMFLRVEILQQVGLFDPRYFMYMEDFDLVRRIHRHAKTVFYPYVSVIHLHKKESYQNPRMLLTHMVSALKYFNKWGWVFDSERKKFNESVLEEIRKQEGQA